MTAYYSKGAKSSAEAAKEAARETRNSVSLIDSIGTLSEISRLLDDLRRRLETRNWELISERCASLRALIAQIDANRLIVDSDEIANTIAFFREDIKKLGERADKIRFGKVAEPDLAKLSSNLASHTETMVRTTLYVKTRLGDTSER